MKAAKAAKELRAVQKLAQKILTSVTSEDLIKGKEI
jgi:hypothetical protein